VGYRLAPGQAVIALPGKLTLSVLPYTPHGRRLAQAAFEAGKEVMLHAPMSSLRGVPLGRGGLTRRLPEAEFRATLDATLDQLPHVRGINNHMGSDLTQRERQMGWVMSVLRERGLYFIDSRTTALTVAAGTAERYAVPHLSRKVFLDNERDAEAIDRSFRRLLREVEREGLAVGIGHPHPETIAYLRAELPKLACRGIELALVSEVLGDGAREVPERPPSEPDFDAPLRHVGLGLWDGVLPEVEDTGRQHRVGATDQHPLDQVIQVSHAP
jgi:polysaccharide deacetylase 2 family uncharacterized protein YibQ